MATKSGGTLGSPPPERGRSPSAARRVGVSRFNRTREKTEFARRLRRDQTDVEATVWQRLRRGQIEGYDFRRQHPAGPYVLDFYCSALRLAIELDGGQHAEDMIASKDAHRSAWLAERGVTVVRFWNSDITGNLNGVLERIRIAVLELKERGAAPIENWQSKGNAP